MITSDSEGVSTHQRGNVQRFLFMSPNKTINIDFNYASLLARQSRKWLRIDAYRRRPLALIHSVCLYVDHDNVYTFYNNSSLFMFVEKYIADPSVCHDFYV